MQWQRKVRSSTNDSDGSMVSTVTKLSQSGWTMGRRKLGFEYHNNIIVVRNYEQVIVMRTR